MSREVVAWLKVEQPPELTNKQIGGAGEHSSLLQSTVGAATQ
jgi:hypothetical protein